MSEAMANGFFLMPRAAVQDVRLSHADARLLMIVAAWRNTQSGIAWPALSTLARAMGCRDPEGSRRYVRRVLGRLVRLGYLDRVEAGGGRGLAGAYRVRFDSRLPTAAAVAAPAADAARKRAVAAPVSTLQRSGALPETRALTAPLYGARPVKRNLLRAADFAAGRDRDRPRCFLCGDPPHHLVSGRPAEGA